MTSRMYTNDTRTAARCRLKNFDLCISYAVFAQPPA